MFFIETRRSFVHMRPDLHGQRSIAIICFIPDFGHLQPLLKMAHALNSAGFLIKCYIASECAPLLKRFEFETFELGAISRQEFQKEMDHFFKRSSFFTSMCQYIHYLALYPKISAGVGREASRLSEELQRQRPDLIISDALWFGDWYARIAQSLSVRLLVNSFDGSLAYSQRSFVRTFGLGGVPRSVQVAVEGISSLLKILCSSYYRVRFFGEWLKLRSIRRTATAQFNAAFPVNGREAILPEWLVFGTASLERARLSPMLQLKGATRREFPALKFHSSVPLSDDLWAWINADARRPIVYVSFGSAVEIDGRFSRAVYDGLRSLDIRVIWSLPANQRSLVTKLPMDEKIRFESFVPQPEILDLAQVRCFVTQAGPHSVQEALFGATPMLCIPFFADQAYNASVVEHLGAGKKLRRRDVSAQAISSGVRDVLNSEECQGKAKTISEELLCNEGSAAISEYVAGLLRSNAQ
jgi:UDP-N-acetylglucosamine:LPS N-acetylglucosamine transferase